MTFLKLIRFPNLLIVLLSQYCVAIFLTGRDEDIFLILSDIGLLLISLSTMAIAAAGYIINDYYDIKIDYINKPDRVIIGKTIKRRVAIVWHIFLTMAGIGIAFIVSLEIGIIALVAAFVLWLYSNLLKRLPLAGNLSVAFLAALCIYMVWIYFPVHHGYVLAYSLFAFFINLTREIIKDIEDLKGDQSFGCRTLPITWGISKTKIFLYLITVSFIIMLIIISWSFYIRILPVYLGVLSVILFYFMWMLKKASSISDFSRLSRLNKIIMILGILSMVIFKF